MSATELLPPATAVRIAWARTGRFAPDEHSQYSATIAEDVLKELKAQSQGDPRENRYVLGAAAAIDACLRNLDTIYKGRQLNFQENDKVRKTHLDTIQDNLEFGSKARDLLKSMPGMVIGGAGSITLAQVFLPNWPAPRLASLGLLCAALGYLVMWAISWWMAKEKRKLYVREDYERDLYYQQYVDRVTCTLIALYLDIDRLHRNAFAELYPAGRAAEAVVREMLAGVRPTFCPRIHEHMRDGAIEPKQWPVCETGDELAVNACPLK